MSAAPEEDVRPITRELILAIMGPDVDEEELKICEDEAVAKFYTGNVVAPHSNDVRKIMDGLALKFEVRGLSDFSTSFKHNVESFTSEYRKLTLDHPDPYLTLDGCEWRILHFLHLMSWNPVEKEIRRLTAALDNSELNLQPPPTEEDKAKPFDWAAYLLEGIPVWDPPIESDSDASQLSDDSDEANSLGGEVLFSSSSDYSNIAQDGETSHSSQATWSLTDETTLYPHSAQKLLSLFKQEFDAEAALATNLHSPWWLETAIPLRLSPEPTIQVVTEYSLIRELMWLLAAPSFETHCFKIQDKLYIPRGEISIKGIHQGTLWTFMNDMCEYVNMVMEIEEFDISLKGLNEYQCSKTYTAYNAALKSFLQAFKTEVQHVELKVHEQNAIITLVSVFGALKPWLNNLRFLATMHRKATANWKAFPKWSMAVRLLSVWLEAAMGVTSKQHVTIAFIVFLKSFRPYFLIIGQWFRFGQLNDPCEEFIICRQPWQYGVIPSLEKMWTLGFIMQPFQQYVTCDVFPPTLLKLILTAGKSIDVIQSVGKIAMVQPDRHYPVVEETYFQFLHYLDISLACHEKDDGASRSKGVLCLPLAKEHRFTSAVIAMQTPDNAKLEQVDHVYKNDYMQVYERIASHTSQAFLPIGKLLGEEEIEVMKPRADLISSTLKEILIQDYILHVRFAMLKTLFFLDHPDFVEVFKSLYMQRNRIDRTRNNYFIVLGVRDIMEQVCPIFNTMHYRLVIDNKFYSEDNIISAMKFISYEYPVEWPLSIIIKARHVKLYNDIFHFLLPLKWVLHAVSHLPTREIDYDTESGISRTRFIRYQTLRFWLLSSLGGLNTFYLHYILQFYSDTMTNNVYKATNFEMILEAHDLYLDCINKLCCCHGSKLQLFISQLVELASCFAVTWNIRHCNMMDNKLTDMENFYSTLYRQIIRELDSLIVQHPSQSEKLEEQCIYEELYCTFNSDKLPEFGRPNTSNRN